MKLFRLLALRRLRQQPVRAILGIAAVAAGSSLAVAVAIVISSTSASIDRWGQAFSGPAPLRVVGASTRGGIEPGVVDRVRTVPGVTAAVPVLRAVVLVHDVDGLSGAAVVLGVDCSIEAIVGPVGCTPEALALSGSRPLLIGPGLARNGFDAEVGSERIPLDGINVAEQLSGLGGGNVIVFSRAGAAALLQRQDRLDVVFVTTAAGASTAEVADRLRDVVGEHNAVLKAGEAPAEVKLLMSAFIPLLGLMGVFSLGTGAVLIHNSLTLSVEERRRQIAVLAALGGTARHVAGGLIVEAAVIGLLGGAVGVLGGIAIAGPIVGTLSDFAQEIAGIPFSVSVRPASVVFAGVLGLVLGGGAALLPAWRAMQADVSAELSGRAEADEGRAPRLWLRLGLAAAFAGTGLFGSWMAARDGAIDEWQATIGPPSLLVAIVGLLFCGAATAPLLAQATGRASRQGGATSRLANASLAREPRRTAVMATAIGAAVMVAFTASSYNKSVTTAITTSFERNLTGIAVSTFDPDSSGGGVESSLSAADLDRLRALPGAASVERSAVIVTGAVPENLVGVVAFSDAWFANDVLAGTINRDAFTTGQAVIGPTIARERGLRPADKVRLPTPSGMVELPVLAVHANGDFGGRNVTIPLDLAERLYGPQPTSAVLVEPAPGTSAEDLAQRIRAAGFGDRFVETPREVATRVAGNVSGQMAPFWVLQRGLMIVAFVAVLSTLLLVGAQRRRELATLAAVGMAPRAAAGLVLTEGVAVAVGGVVIAVLFAPLSLWAILQVVPLIVGWRNPYTADWSSLVVYGFAVIVLAALAERVARARRRSHRPGRGPPLRLIRGDHESGLRESLAVTLVDR